jgi:TPP-dependent pyruvate/acetoin dehydrogenase alpha subunit
MTVDGMDVLAVRDAARALAGRIRAGEGPAFLECVAERFASHSTATRETRSAAELEAVRARCPIRRLATALSSAGTLAPDAWRAMERDATDAAARAIRYAEASPPTDVAEITRDVG